MNKRLTYIIHDNAKSGVLVAVTVILLAGIIIGSLIFQPQGNKQTSSGQSQNTYTNLPNTSSAPLQMQYFDLNSIPLTTENGAAIISQNEDTLSTVLANTDDDLNAIDQINTKEDSQGL